MRQNIAIVGGGTGGHLSIARSVKEALNRRGIKPFFIGSIGGQDKQWFEQDEGFEEKYFFAIPQTLLTRLPRSFARSEFTL